MKRQSIGWKSSRASSFWLPKDNTASSKDRQETVVMQLFCFICYCILWKYSNKLSSNTLSSNKMPNPYLFSFKGGNICKVSYSLFHLHSQQWNIPQEVRKRKPILTSLLIIFFHWMVLGHWYPGLAWWLLFPFPSSQLTMWLDME